MVVGPWMLLISTVNNDDDVSGTALDTSLGQRFMGSIENAEGFGDSSGKDTVLQAKRVHRKSSKRLQI